MADGSPVRMAEHRAQTWPGGGRSACFSGQGQAWGPDPGSGFKAWKAPRPLSLLPGAGDSEGRHWSPGSAGPGPWARGGGGGPGPGPCLPGRSGAMRRASPPLGLWLHSSGHLYADIFLLVLLSGVPRGAISPPPSSGSSGHASQRPGSGLKQPLCQVMGTQDCPGVLNPVRNRESNLHLTPVSHWVPGPSQEALLMAVGERLPGRAEVVGEKNSVLFYFPLSVLRGWWPGASRGRLCLVLPGRSPWNSLVLMQLMVPNLMSHYYYYYY